MPWDNSPDKRRRDAAAYGDPEYRRNRALALKRAGGACENMVNGRRCGSRDRVQCDHITPLSQGGTHSLGNLRCLCRPCHDRKSAQEGGGYRRPGWRAKGDPPLTRRTQW